MNLKECGFRDEDYHKILKILRMFNAKKCTIENIPNPNEIVKIMVVPNKLS